MSFSPVQPSVAEFWKKNHTGLKNPGKPGFLPVIFCVVRQDHMTGKTLPLAILSGSENQVCQNPSFG
ncbi:hypothetical protein ACFO1V_08740 [Daeguia caeni]|uniref:Uncharacterized protein n=1 Tax=Daeguia caeni TaxID=439612 RepID=A0ABV9H772_9HYPH